MGARLTEVIKGTLALPDPNAQIVIGSALDGGDVIGLAHLQGVRQLVQRDSLEFDRELKLAEIMVADPNRFFEEPAATILGESDQLASFAVAVTAAERKTELLKDFGEFVGTLLMPRSFFDQTQMIADELYTNGSKNTHANVRDGHIEFFAQADSQRLVIGCRDSFGELNISEVIRRIWSCYEMGVANLIRFGTSGAGIGSFMVFEACASYCVGVKKGVATVVCVTLPLRLNQRKAVGLPKNLHLIEQ